MPAHTEPPPEIQTILSLRPPLATSTRTDLGPSFKLLRALVNTVYGSPGCRGLEPGLWRAQLGRAAQRTAQLIQAVWSKLGGDGGVIVDDEGEGGRGVMRLQGVISDLQIFAGSIASVQDPLTTFLLDTATFSRTQATVKSLVRKVAALVAHYKVCLAALDSLPLTHCPTLTLSTQVSELIRSPVSQWPEEDQADEEEDFAALPLLIAKSRPSRALLRRFEAHLAQPEPTDPDGPPPETESESPTSPSLSPQSSRRASSATPGLSAVNRSQFLRFVYSQNPILVGAQGLDNAVAVGAVAVATMGHPARTASAPDESRPPGSRTSSLVQQRISNFANSGTASPPLPSSLNVPPVNRRIVSDSTGSSRKTWTVDMSGLDAIQRCASGPLSRPPPSGFSLGPSVSVIGPTTRLERVSPATSIKSKQSADEVLPELAQSDKKQAKQLSARSTPETSSEEAKPPPIASFAEQAAAIVAARNRRTGALSKASWTIKHAPSSSRLSLMPAHEPGSTPLPTESTNVPFVPSQPPTPIIIPSELAEEPTAAEAPIAASESASLQTSQSQSPDTLPLPPVSASPTSISLNSQPLVRSAISEPIPLIPTRSQQSARKQSTASSTRFRPVSPAPFAPPVSSVDTPDTSSSSASIFSTSVRPPLELDPEFEIMADLIEDQSLLDVIVGPSSTPPATGLALALEPTSQTEPWSPPVLSLPELDQASPSKLPNLKPAPAAPNTEEPSLSDLLHRASMFENWEGPREEPALTTPSTLRESTLRQSVRKPPSAGSLSPPVSARLRTPLSPPLTLSSSSRNTNACISLNSPTAALGRSGSNSSALKLDRPESPTRSFSGLSWATSLMSAPPAPPDFDLAALTGSLFVNTDQATSVRGWRILSLDGGGIRGLSMLFVLHSILERVQRRASLPKLPLPCECFDMICGVGTGGIIALLLGRLHMSIDDAIDAYLSVSRSVFGQGKGALAVLLGKTRYSASKLEVAMQAVVEAAATDARAGLSEPEGMCRTFVMAMRTSNGTSGGRYRTLRSYPTRQVLGDPCSIFQAARATSASPLFFKPVAFGSDALASVPRSASLNNPALEAVNEARSLFPDRNIELLVSLGAGRSMSIEGSIGRACAEISDACQNAANGVEAVATTEGWNEAYVRLNAELASGAANCEWEVASLVREATIGYLDSPLVAERVEGAVDMLTIGIVNLQDEKNRLTPLREQIRPARVSSSGHVGGVRTSISLETMPNKINGRGVTGYRLEPFLSTGSLQLPQLNFD